MKLISREELKEKLDRGDDFKLVNALAELAFQAKHIPGSINISAPEVSRKMLNPDDEIVVYCSGPDCIASVQAFNIMEANGYTKVRRYAGGILDWDEAGYPLKGKM
ncbi:MAG: rhodanese-like domain-containing protein, partial [Candidatus Hydrothermarchaeales archaeon]